MWGQPLPGLGQGRLVRLVRLSGLTSPHLMSLDLTGQRGLARSITRCFMALPALPRQVRYRANMGQDGSFLTLVGSGAPRQLQECFKRLQDGSKSAPGDLRTAPRAPQAPGRLPRLLQEAQTRL